MYFYYNIYFNFLFVSSNIFYMIALHDPQNLLCLSVPFSHIVPCNPKNYCK